MSQRHRTAGFSDIKGTGLLKLKGLHKGQRVVSRQGQKRAQVSFV